MSQHRKFLCKIADVRLCGGGVRYLLDDIRRLSSTPEGYRNQLVTNLWRHTSLYNPRASLSIPIVSAMAYFPGPSSTLYKSKWGNIWI